MPSGKPYIEGYRTRGQRGGTGGKFGSHDARRQRMFQEASWRQAEALLRSGGWQPVKGKGWGKGGKGKSSKGAPNLAATPRQPPARPSAASSAGAGSLPVAAYSGLPIKAMPAQAKGPNYKAPPPPCRPSA